MKNQLIERFIKFEKLLGVTAIVVALVAAFFSVYGIATLFAGAFVLTAIMASSLEVGKLVAVTFLYRYWNDTKGFLKTYLTLATLILMMVTSIGIFGYLSAAYQKSSVQFKANQEKIVMVENRKPYLNDKINQSKNRIQILNDMRKIQEARLSEALTNSFLTRNPIQLKQIQDQTVELVKSADNDIKTEQFKIDESQNELQKVDQQINEMKFSSADKKDIQTFQFVADQFGTTLDNVAKWFIIILIFVFDPLAVALILAYNVSIYKNTENLSVTTVSEPTIITSPNVSKPSVVSRSVVSYSELPKHSTEVSSSFAKVNTRSI